MLSPTAFGEIFRVDRLNTRREGQTSSYITMVGEDG